MNIPPADMLKLSADYSAARTASERSEIIRRYAAEWRVSERTARNHAGVTTKPAAPAPALVDPVMDELVSRWLASATEKYKTATMPIRDLLTMCEDAGVIEHGQVSESRFRRYLRTHRITLDDQRRGRPHITLASLHPNHAHLADVTRCRQWYLRDDGRFDMQSFKRGTAEYRNKDLRGIPLYRYVLVDHTTGTPWVQYYTDETAVTLLTFLASAWLPKRGRVAPGPTGVTRRWLTPFTPEGWDEWTTLELFRNYPFRGVPKVLVLDRASANQSEFTRELCRRLDVQLVIAQEARAKGAVEGMMWIWETKFETRLATQPATDRAELNLYAADFTEYFCRRYVHSRHGMTRSQAWGLITPEQLRELDDWPRFADAARRAPTPRVVKSGDAGSGFVSYEGRTWRLDSANYIGQTVGVSVSAFSPDELIAQTADGHVFLLQEVGRTAWGYSERAPVIGEAFASHPYTVTDTTKARAAKLRETLEPIRVFGLQGEKLDAPALIGPRRGVEVSIQSTLGTREISRAQFNERVRAARNQQPFTEAMAAKREELFAGTRVVAESAVDDFLAWCAAQDAAGVADRKVVNLFRGAP